MKKNFLKTFCCLMLAFLVFSGCHKITEQEMMSEDMMSEKDPQNQANNKNDDDENGCRLLSFEQSNGYREDFHYNRNGLADRWRVDYGDGTIYDHHIAYDNKDRIKSTRLIIPGDVVNYIFYNSNGHTSRVTGRLQSTGELWNDVFYSYNNKGQMVRLDDNVVDIHSRFLYDNKGFNRQINVYFGNELSYTFLINYDIPNKNPYLALNGVDFGFPSYFFNSPLFDKRWNSSGSVIVYEEGNPIVIAEDDPAQTIIHTGKGHYATYASYYDIPSESSYNMVFSYTNCGRGKEDDSKTETTPSIMKKSPMNAMTRLKKILNGDPKNIKQGFLEFKKQCLNQLKTTTKK